MMVQPAALLLVAIAGAPAPVRVRAECDGVVDWRTREGGDSVLRMSGGVRVRRGEFQLRSESAQIKLDPGAESPTHILVEDEVVLTSRQFTALAGSAEMKNIALPETEGARPCTQTVQLNRGDRAWIELRSGALVIVCAGPLVYEPDSLTALLRGGVRGEDPRMLLRAAEAKVVFSPPAPPQKPPEGGEQTRPPARGDAADRIANIERIDLAGSVEIETRPSDGSARRRARAQRAVYLAGENVLRFSGEPPPEIESAGVVITGPELRLYLGENRIDSPTGTMKAVVEPPHGESR